MNVKYLGPIASKDLPSSATEGDVYRLTDSYETFNKGAYIIWKNNKWSAIPVKESIPCTEFTPEQRELIDKLNDDKVKEWAKNNLVYHATITDNESHVKFYETSGTSVCRVLYQMLLYTYSKYSAHTKDCKYNENQFNILFQNVRGI